MTGRFDSLKAFAEIWHNEHVERNRQCFSDLVPADRRIYVYTYYSWIDADNAPDSGDWRMYQHDLGIPLYHGWTQHAQQRATQHRRSAPWAPWVTDVRYRECSSPASAYALESRLQRTVPSLCHIPRANGRGLTRTYHGERWPADELGWSHVNGSCRMPGGICTDEWLSAAIERAQTEVGACLA